MKVRLFACAISVTGALTGCGGKKGTIELDIVHDALSNPLLLGNEIEIIAGPHSDTATLSDGTYSLSFDESPPKTAYNLVIEELDAEKNIVAYGETPLVTLNAVDQGPFGVWLGQPGTIGRSPSALTAATTSMAGCNVVGLGAVVAGGESGGAAVTTSYVYDSFTSAIIDTAAMTTARYGGVAIPAPGKGVIFGGSSSVTPLTSLATAEAFDPTSGGSGQWLTVNPTTTVLAASFPSVALFPDGSGLVTGGFGTDGVTPTNATTIVTTASAVAFGAATNPMNAPRVHHVSAPLLFGSAMTSGGIVIGGLPTGSTGTVVETYENGLFTPNASAAVATIPNLWNATATAFNANTSVFVMGGGVAGGPATNTAFVITTLADGTLSVTDVTNLNLIARKNHTATLIGSDILLCGGIDAAGTALGNCDLVTTTPVVAYDTTKNPISNLVPRENHVAVALETGPVVFIGGDDGNGTALTQIDVYTPTMTEEAIVNTQNSAVIGAATDGGT